MTIKATVYDQFDAAFAGISAYAVSKGPEQVGRVIFKRSGMRSTCYLQVWGSPMVRAFASGGGYDKDSFAFAKAAARLSAPEHPDPSEIEAVWAFKNVKGEGYAWKRELEDAGYTVQHIID